MSLNFHPYVAFDSPSDIRKCSSYQHGTHAQPKPFSYRDTQNPSAFVAAHIDTFTETD